jgi:hypothetical protein
MEPAVAPFEEEMAAGSMPSSYTPFVLRTANVGGINQEACS